MDKDMIAAVRQVGNQVRVYNERGLVLFMKCGELVGYTGNTISVKYNHTVWCYDLSGRCLFGK